MPLTTGPCCQNKFEWGKNEGEMEPLQNDNLPKYNLVWTEAEVQNAVLFLNSVELIYRHGLIRLSLALHY